MASFSSSLVAKSLRTLSLMLLCCVLTLTAFSQAAQAASPSRQVLEVTVNKVLALLADPAFANPATREKQRARIEVEVRKVFDFSEFSARTAGQRWRSFNADQQNRFAEAFADLLLTTYLGQLQNYNGEQVRYTGERSNAKGTRVEQLTEITMHDGKIIPVAYRMMPKKGTWVVYDVLVEGVSLVKNYRTQFQDILATASPDDLIARIQAKAKEVRNRK
ncbi:MAG TPA: ABC transporter substrate-binding protein [Candidatus Desulfovibrio intestinipullorum]|uniref:ABC transporter substrate-binding protein n=1 Tax=Candidatus Desulfovibrio intestinipullorum TaxID=2838536 RepID=A0A9D1PXV1_9BACT|nr:ABC transporter substrate-binding protein [Candidatus Desulfovibrio intestinipullorum]